MSQSELERLGNDFRDNKALREEAKEIGSDANKLIEFATKKGYDITMDDLPDVSESGELSDEALKSVVGGRGAIVTNNDGMWFVGSARWALVMN